MHVDIHPVAPVPADRRGNNHQRVLGDKVPDTPPWLGLVVRAGYQIELERIGSGNKKQQQAADLPQ
jgi:hypothetical protein